MLKSLMAKWKVRRGGDPGASIGEPKVINGHRFYYVRPELLPVIRKKGYQRALTECEWGTTRGDLDAFIEVLREAINKADLVSAGALINYFDEYRLGFTPKKVLIKLATNFILIDGEPLAEMPQKYTELKWRLCENNKSVEDFFLSSSLNLVLDFEKPLTASEIRAYFKDRMEGASKGKIEKAFLDTIGSKAYHPD